MWTKNSPINEILYASYLGWFPLVLRDVGFRAILLGFYYASTEVEHKPMLKYSIPQISDFMRQRREILSL
jgi:hypothetical protein